MPKLAIPAPTKLLSQPRSQRLSLLAATARTLRDEPESSSPSDKILKRASTLLAGEGVPGLQSSPRLTLKALGISRATQQTTTRSSKEEEPRIERSAVRTALRVFDGMRIPV